MNKTARVLVTYDCFQNCPGCVNKSVTPSGIFDPSMSGQYDEIILTGGEPMFFPSRIRRFVQEIKSYNFSAKVILYSSYFDPKFTDELKDTLTMVNGYTFTVHNNEFSVKRFLQLDCLVADWLALFQPGTLRLNIDSRLKDYFDKYYTDNFCQWHQRKYFDFDPDCKLPEHEIFLSLKKLWII